MFSNLNSNCSNLLYLRNLQEQVKTVLIFHFALFKQIVVVISKFLQILGLQPRISKVFLDHQNIFFSQQVKTILVTKYHLQLSKCVESLFVAFYLHVGRSAFYLVQQGSCLTFVQNRQFQTRPISDPSGYYRMEHTEGKKYILKSIFSWISVQHNNLLFEGSHLILSNLKLACKN